MLEKLFRYAPDDGGGAAPAGAQPGTGEAGSETPPAFDYAKWLEEQPDDVKAALKGQFETETANLKTTLEKERDARKALEKEAKDRAKAQDDAQKAKLQEEGQYKELAEQLEKRAADAETKLAELTAKAEQVDRYSKALETYVAEARKGVPAYVTELLDTMDPVAQLEYLSKHADDLRKPTPGGPPTGGPGGSGGGLSAEEIQKRAYHRRSL